MRRAAIFLYQGSRECQEVLLTWRRIYRGLWLLLWRWCYISKGRGRRRCIFRGWSWISKGYRHSLTRDNLRKKSEKKYKVTNDQNTFKFAKWGFIAYEWTLNLFEEKQWLFFIWTKLSLVIFLSGYDTWLETFLNKNHHLKKFKLW